MYKMTIYIVITEISEIKKPPIQLRIHTDTTVHCIFRTKTNKI